MTWILLIVAFVAIGVLGLAIVELARRIELLTVSQLGAVHPLMVPDHGLERGAAVPTLLLESISGDPQSVGIGLGSQLVLFVSATCAACSALMRELKSNTGRRFVEEHSGAIHIVCVSIGHPSASNCGQMLADLPVGITGYVDSTGAAQESFKVTMTPSATLLVDQRVAVHAVANNIEQISNLFKQHVKIDMRHLASSGEEVVQIASS